MLVETPVGKYFSQILEEKSAKLESAAEVRHVLEEVEIEILKNSLMKLYLEDFYYFCQVCMPIRIQSCSITFVCVCIATRR